MTARQVALGGVFAAAAVAVMLLGGLIPVGIYLAPMVAALPLVVLLQQLPAGLCVGWYVVVAVLTVLLCPDKETAFVFVFLGWYPILRPRLEPLPRPLRLGVKLLVFFLAVGAMYGLLLFVFRLDALVAEARAMGTAMLLVLLALGTVCFLLFDALLARLTERLRLRKKR